MCIYGWMHVCIYVCLFSCNLCLEMTLSYFIVIWMIIFYHEETMLRSFWRQDICALISFVYFRVVLCSCIHIVFQVVSVHNLSVINRPSTEWIACNLFISLCVFCSFIGLVFQIWLVIDFGSHSMLLQLLLTRPCTSPLRSYPKNSQGSIWIYLCF